MTTTPRRERIAYKHKRSRQIVLTARYCRKLIKKPPKTIIDIKDRPRDKSYKRYYQE